MSSLFLSYRRSDCPDTVKLLHERLKTRLPRWEIFYDHQSIQPGEAFPDRLRTAVTTAEVVFVIIGPQWLRLLQERGALPVDHVYEEIKLALFANRLVIPVLVQNASMPCDADLADFPALVALPSLNAKLPLRPEPDFDSDLDKLVAFLEPLGPSIDVGTVLAGNYRLVSLIGEGGMGIVYKAHQLQPKRDVAVKLIKPGMDSKEVLARFGAERQALAVMNHPNIAKVLEAGTTAAGRPFFVMEYVKGVPITQYCDEKKLTPNERLKLYRHVCEAVQHAHQKGIIHRDIKPTNVLVETVDGQPVPKVIDFGLAKALNYKLTDASGLMTQSDAVVGTLLYSSPEQAAGKTNDIDTRTDIYSLGALLYELLVGEPPFTEAELNNVGQLAMKQRIIDNEPSTPSAKLSSSHSLPSIAANRQLDPAKLTRQVRGELDWIVMKALEKEPNRRYATATSLGEDIEHYLNHEPITAGKPSTVHRLRKFVCRHRTPVVATALIIMALVTGIVGTTLGIFEAKRQEGFARDEWKRANDATIAEEAAKDLAIKRFQQLDRANEVVADLVTSQDPLLPIYAQVPPELSLARKLDAIIPKLDELSGGDPLIRAKLQLAVGTALTSIGEGRKAITLLNDARDYYRREHGVDHAATIQATFQSALCEYSTLNRPQEAVTQLESLESRCEAVFGPNAEITGNVRWLRGMSLCQTGQFTEGLQKLEEVVTYREKQFPADDPRTLAFQLVLLSRYALAGDTEKRRRVADTILQRKQSWTQLTMASNPYQHAIDQLTNSLDNDVEDGKDDGIEAIEKVYQLTRKLYGAYHPATCLQAISLGQLYVVKGQFTEALMICGETHRNLTELYGDDHFLTLLNQSVLAAAYLNSKKVDQAYALIEPCYRKAVRVFGMDDAYLMEIKTVYAACLAARRDIAGAITEYREALARSRKSMGEGHISTLMLSNILAGLYNREKRPAEATELLKAVSASSAKTHGIDSPLTIESEIKLAEQYVKVGEYELGFKMLDDATIRAVSRYGIKHKNAVQALGYSERVYSSQLLTEREKIITARRQSVKAWTNALGAENPGTLKAELALANVLVDLPGSDEGFILYDQLIEKHKAAKAVDATELSKILSISAGSYRTKAISFPVGSSERRSFAAKAVEYQRDQIELKPNQTPDDRQAIAHSTWILARMCILANQQLDALAACESLWKNQESLRQDGLDDVFFLGVVGQLRSLYREVKNYEAALDMSLTHYEMTKRSDSRAPISGAESLAELVLSYRQTGQHDKALELADSMTDAELAKLRTQEYRVASILWNLALAYQDAGKLDRAIPLYRRATVLLEKEKYGSQDSVAILSDYVECCESLDDFAGVERFRRRLVILTREKSGDQSAAYSNQLALLSRNLLRQKKWSDAEPYLRETLTLREKLVKEPKSNVASWSVLNAKSMLGESLFRQQKLVEAGPLVIQGYEGLLGNEQLIPPALITERIFEATDRMVRYLVLTGKPEDAVAVTDDYLSWVEKQKENRDDCRYNAACLYALCVGKEKPNDDLIGKVVSELEKCRDAGMFNDPDNLVHFARDEDFIAIRSSERFLMFMSTLKPEVPPASASPPVGPENPER